MFSYVGGMFANQQWLYCMWRYVAQTVNLIPQAAIAKFLSHFWKLSMDHFQNHLLIALVNGMGPLLFLLDFIYLPTPVDTNYPDMYSI